MNSVIPDSQPPLFLHFLSASTVILALASLLMTGPALFAAEQETVDQPQPVDEIVVRDQPRRAYIHRGWEPESAADVDAEIERTYGWLNQMATHAEACDIDSIAFLQTYTQRKPCEDFVETVSAYFEYYGDACQALIEWHARFAEELRAIPDVETEYAGTLNWMALVRQNIDITCNLTRIREDRPKFEVAIDQIGRIVRFVNSDSWLGADGAPRQLTRGAGVGLPTQGQSVINGGGPN